ncbi:hypothetical protein T10_12945, partial [Trichinella papuae]
MNYWSPGVLRSVPRPPTLVVPHKIIEASGRPPDPPWSIPFSGLGPDVPLCMGSRHVGSDNGPLERPSCAEDITRSSWWFTTAGGCFLINAGMICLQPVAVNDQTSPRSSDILDAVRLDAK